MSTRAEGGISLHYLSHNEVNNQWATQIDHRRLDMVNEKKFSNSEQFFQICELYGFSRKHFLFPGAEFALKPQNDNTDKNFFAHLHKQKDNLVYDILDARLIHKMIK